MGEEASAAVPALLTILKDTDAAVRLRAAAALGAMGKETSAVVPVLIAALKDKDQATRFNAAEALGAMGKEASAAVPALTVALKDKEDVIRSAALTALGEIGEEAVSPLVEALKDKDAFKDGRIPYVLGNIKPPPQQAIKPLLTVANDEKNDRKVRRTTAVALDKLGQKMEPFFISNDFVPLDRAACPSGQKLNLDTKECRSQPSSGLSGGVSLYTAVRRMFGG